MNETVYLAALNRCFEGNWKKAHELLKYYGSAEAIFKAGPRQLKPLLPGLDTIVTQLASPRLPDEAFEELERCRRDDIEVCSINDDSFPERLAETADAPLVLFRKGSRKLNGARFLAMVGTRHCTQYSQKYCDLIAEYMSSLTIKPVIVSGMAYGIDSCAHRSALRYGLDTIAVTATGHDTVYPPCNRNLAAEIMERGAVVTEYWSGTPSLPYNFVNRNRIIAGLSDATVVIESPARGGSLITARAAFNYNREVFAFPGKMEDTHFTGCNMLIAENIAQLVTGIPSIGKALEWLPDNCGARMLRAEAASLSPQKRTLLQILGSNGEMDAAQLAASCGENVSTVSLLLLELEMDGFVRHISANKYLSL